MTLSMPPISLRQILFTTAAVVAVLHMIIPSRPAMAQPQLVIDLLQVDPETDAFERIYGSVGDGTFGVPVAGPGDCDGDGLPDSAFAAFLGDPFGRLRAGEIYLIFGHGAVSGRVDTAGFEPTVLKIAGAQAGETAGSEIWLDDVTGDGIADLIIGRQSFTTSLGLLGAGALSVVKGGPELRQHAATLQYLDLDSIPASLTVTTITGEHPLDRFGIWMRTGDVTGDGVRDIVVAADQESTDRGRHSGVGYLVRGGVHLASGGEIDLGVLEGTPLAGQIARVLPPAGSNEYHLGATCQIADLDGNGRGEVLLAAALNRAGATFEPIGASQPSHPVGGSTTGTLYIAWDDNFGSGPWPDGLTVDLGAPLGARSILRGGTVNRKFGEEIIGGLDYNNDGLPDLFVGDLTGDASAAGDRPNSGVGHLLLNAPALKGINTDVGSLPPEIASTVFAGPTSGSIAADTTVHGDFDDDGIADIAFSAPHASPAGRLSAGIVYIFHGQSEPWPALIDLRDTSGVTGVRLTEIWGALGRRGGDDGDVLAYSASAGDLDFDGRHDLLINEMTGNGLLPGTEDVGNMVVLGAELLGAKPACAPEPVAACRHATPIRARLDLQRGKDEAGNRLTWRWLARTGGALADFKTPPSSLANYALCVYDSSGASQPVIATPLLAGLDCTASPCWRAAGASAFRYRRGDAKPRGVERARLAARDGGASGLRVRAKGEDLTLPEAPLVLPATVQLVISGGASVECWQAEYQEAIKNEAGRFVARSP